MREFDDCPNCFRLTTLRRMGPNVLIVVCEPCGVAWLEGEAQGEQAPELEDRQWTWIRPPWITANI